MVFLNYRWEESNSGAPKEILQNNKKKGKLFLSELTVTWEELFKAVFTISKSKQK